MNYIEHTVIACCNRIWYLSSPQYEAIMCEDWPCLISCCI